MAQEVTEEDIDQALQRIHRRIEGAQEASRASRRCAELQRQHLRTLPREQIRAIHEACKSFEMIGFNEVQDIAALREEAARCLADGSSSAPPEATRAFGEKAANPTAVEKDAQEVPRPPGMATPQEVTAQMWRRQWNDPRKWTLTFRQWEQVLKHAVQSTTYRELKRKTRFLSMYDLKDHFVIPWTKGTGCGLATLMSKQDPPDATLMLSHAWAEDVEECMEAMRSQVDRMGRSEDDVWVWFCVFANYQCEDGAGPSIRQQLDMNPFETVIQSQAVKVHGMCAIHTTQEDLYNRLWCVHEIAAAKTEHLPVSAAISEAYTERALRRMKYFYEAGFDHVICLRAAGVSCDTVKAQCRAEDEPMLIRKILEEHKDFGRLDDVIKEFRISTLPPEVAEMIEVAKFRSKDKEFVCHELKCLIAMAMERGKLNSSFRASSV